MSSEKISINDEKSFSALETPKVITKALPGRVNINDLLARVREEKKKEYRVNLVIFGLFALLVLIIGIILSL